MEGCDILNSQVLVVRVECHPFLKLVPYDLAVVEQNCLLVFSSSLWCKTLGGGEGGGVFPGVSLVMVSKDWGALLY